MTQFLDEIKNHLEKFGDSHAWRIAYTKNSLVMQDTPEAYAELHAALNQLKSFPQIYWQTVNVLHEQEMLDAVTYFESVLSEPSNNQNIDLQIAALQHLSALDYDDAVRLICMVLNQTNNENLIRQAVSLLAEQTGADAVYYLSMFMRTHPNSYARRIAAKDMAYRFDAATLLPIIHNLVYADSVDLATRSAALTIIWHLVIQHHLNDCEVEFVAILKYAMYCLPDMGIMPYRCLMEINVPEAHIVLAEWDIKNKYEALPAAIPIFC